ncbi:MAG: Glycosyltransferase, group 1 family protein, partial [Microgenomates bacterium 39_7]
AKKAEIIHVHDVMVWCLPLRLLFPRKKIILTMHGWEGVYPLPKKNILLKQLGGWLANKVICVGEYVKKYYQVSCDQVVYGGVSDDFVSSLKKTRDIQLMFVGRLEADTGLKILLESLSNLSKDKKTSLRVVFAGDGKLKAECEDFGTVAGWLDEKDLAKKMRQTKLVVAGGYLSALESLAAGCEVIAVADSPLKKDYWQMSELDRWISVASSSDKFQELILNFSLDLVKSKKPQPKEIMRQYSWGNMVKRYLSLYEG